MSLTATLNRNPDAFDTGETITWPLATSGQTNIAGDRSPNLGDIICWDATNGTLFTPHNQADMATFAGVAEQCYPPTSGIDGQSVVNPNGYYLNIRFKGVCYFYGNVGDTFTPGAAVYFDENVSLQTVTSGTNSGARTVPVGYMIPTNSALVAGAAGSAGLVVAVANQLIAVVLATKWPAASI